MELSYYIQRVWSWIIDGTYLFTFVIFLSLPLVFVKFEINETGIRVYGLLLQIIGAVPLLLSLKYKTLLFGKEPFLKSLVTYFKRFPLKIKEERINVSGSSHGISMTVLTPRVKLSPKEDDLKDIIRYFEEEIRVLDERISSERKEIHDKIQKLSESLESYNRLINKNIHDLEITLAKANVSSVGRDYFGIFTLVYGIILATIPDLMMMIYYWE